LSLFGLSLWSVTDAQAATYSFQTLDVPGAVATTASCGFHGKSHRVLGH
jgi:hypothetical protein